MVIVFAVLGVISLGLAVLGGFRPELVVRWGKTRTRERAILTYAVAGAILLIVAAEMYEQPAGQGTVRVQADSGTTASGSGS